MLRGVFWGVLWRVSVFFVFCGVGGVVGFLILFYGLCIVVIKKIENFY